jgi:hypothetical protein
MFADNCQWRGSYVAQTPWSCALRVCLRRDCRAADAHIEQRRWERVPATTATRNYKAAIRQLPAFSALVAAGS